MIYDLILISNTTDNHASLLVRAGGLRQWKRAADGPGSLVLLPLTVSDGGVPPLSSTSTLTIQICLCAEADHPACHPEALRPPLGSAQTQAVAAGLACLLILLGECYQSFGECYQSFSHCY